LAQAITVKQQSYFSRVYLSSSRVYLSSVALTFLALVVAAIFEHWNYHTASLLTFFIAIIILIVTDHVDGAAREEKAYGEIHSTIEDLKRSISGYNIRLLGNSEEALRYLVPRLYQDDLLLVLNTMVVLERSIANRIFYDDYKNAIQDLLSRRKTFLDLVSRHFIGDVDTLRQYAVDHGGDYDYTIVPESAITINFTVLKFKHDASEVLFGWSNSQHFGIDPVFITRDQSLVEYFERLHSEARARYDRRQFDARQFTTRPLQVPVMSTKDFPIDPLAGLYNLNDPRPYFRALFPLHYRQPEVIAEFVFDKAHTIMDARQKDVLRILDFGCGYGAVGALLKFDITLEQLYRYYGRDIEGEASKIDKGYFARIAKASPPYFRGRLRSQGVGSRFRFG
jgi:hypothetical protein